MSGESHASSRGGIGFLGLLTIAFVVLKLTGTISWSWWLVLAPLYAVPVLLLSIAGILFAVVAVANAIERRGRK